HLSFKVADFYGPGLSDPDIAWVPFTGLRCDGFPLIHTWKPHAIDLGLRHITRRISHEAQNIIPWHAEPDLIVLVPQHLIAGPQMPADQRHQYKRQPRSE